MCGLVAGEEKDVPKIWAQLAEKNASTADKKTSVKLHLEENYFWDDNASCVKPLSSLINMIIKRDFDEDMSLSSLFSATKGLTPFATPKVTSQELEKWNEQASDLEKATTKTVKDVASVKRPATCPQSFDELLHHIRRYGNLIFSLFGDQSPMFLLLKQVVKDISQYGEVAQENLSLQSIASILWIIHLQSRHFAAGKLLTTEAVLPEFNHMMHCINSSLPIMHGEVPPALYQPSAPTHDSSTTSTKKRKNTFDTKTPSTKKAKIIKLQHYHPALKKALKPFIDGEGKLPRVQQLCMAANTTADKLFPNYPGICIKSTLYGTCFEDCKRKHLAINDAEATNAIKLLKPVLDDPSKLQVIPSN